MPFKIGVIFTVVRFCFFVFCQSSFFCCLVRLPVIRVGSSREFASFPRNFNWREGYFANVSTITALLGGSDNFYAAFNSPSLHKRAV